MQAGNLKMLQSQGLADRCTTVVESGELSEEMSYLILQPVGKLLTQDEDLSTLLRVCSAGRFSSNVLLHAHNFRHTQWQTSYKSLACDSHMQSWPHCCHPQETGTQGATSTNC